MTGDQAEQFKAAISGGLDAGDMISADEIGLKLLSEQARGLHLALGAIAEEAAALRLEMQRARQDLADAKRDKPWHASEWWQSLSLIQELSSLVEKLRPIVRERGNI